MSLARQLLIVLCAGWLHTSLSAQEIDLEKLDSGLQNRLNQWQPGYTITLFEKPSGAAEFNLGFVVGVNVTQARVYGLFFAGGIYPMLYNTQKFLEGIGTYLAYHGAVHNQCCHPNSLDCNDLAADIGAHGKGCMEALELLEKLEDLDPTSQEYKDCEDVLRGVCAGVKADELFWNGVEPGSSQSRGAYAAADCAARNQSPDQCDPPGSGGCPLSAWPTPDANGNIMSPCTSCD